MRFQTLYEGRWIFAVLIGLAVAGYFIHWAILALAVGLIVFCLNFFRDPDREPPADPDAILAAADGTVAAVAEAEEAEVLHRRVKRIGIFLSVFNVHTNRMPIDGKASCYLQHHPGLFLDARHVDVGTKNEALTWAFEGARATVVVRQITGAIARRIVPWARLGDTLKRGERFGMIRFGSYTEVYCPLDCEITVKIGDVVKGGQTIIARFPSPPTA